MTIGIPEKVLHSDHVTRSAIYEVVVVFNTSWKALILLFEQDGQLVSWQFKMPEDQRRYQVLEIDEQQRLYRQLSNQEILKTVK